MGGDPMITEEMRYQGCLMGLAVGDALGTTVEFKPPGTFAPLTDIVGGGPFGLVKGQWTDDTSMALCLADSLVACRRFDGRDQMDRYTRWRKEGYLSSNGRCFDMGTTVSHALRKYASTGDPFAGSVDPYSAGNGSLMRLAPVPLFFASDPERAVSMSGESSRTTHGAVTCVDACRFFGGLIVGAIQGASKEELLSHRYAPDEGIWDRAPLCAEITEIASGSFKRKEPPEIIGSGYVVQSLEAALWAFYRSSTFEEGCLRAVNLGNDADTTGAIYGQLAGAYYGVEGIRNEWRECIAHADLIHQLAEGLYKNRG
jgi:ADP-ribosyl-[dinitrogen reductase] hydrolase